MPGNLTPPILTEAVGPGPGPAGVSSPAGPAPLQPDRDAGDVGVDSSPMEEARLLEELQALRRWQTEASCSRLELIESHQRRERELTARLDQAHEIIDGERRELFQLRTLHDEQRTALHLQQEQHQNRLRVLNESLSEARQEIERGQGDLQGLRQRCALLEQERDQSERCISDLKHQLQAAREELAHRSAEIAVVQHRCEELEQQRLQSERERAARMEELDQELQVVREELVQRSAELTAARQRCEELEGQRAAARQTAEADHRTLLHELETQRLRDELTAMQQMLEELPDIYEDKFRQRLQPLLEQRDWLLHENSWLRAELPASRPGLLAVQESEPTALAPVAPRRGLLRSMRALLPFGRLGRRLQRSVGPEADQNAGSGAGGDQPATEQFSPGPDDGPPTDASADPRRR